MAIFGNNTGKAKSVPFGMLLAVSVSLVITVLISALLAGALDAEKVTWAQAGYWIMGMLFAASFLGAKSAMIAIKRQRILVAVMSGLLYWGMLLCITALFFGGNFSAVGETAGLITAGSASAALIWMPEGAKKRRKVRSVHC